MVGLILLVLLGSVGGVGVSSKFHKIVVFFLLPALVPIFLCGWVMMLRDWRGRR